MKPAHLKELLAKKPRSNVLMDQIVDAQAKAAGWPKPEREYRFHPVRKWRFDFAWGAKSLGPMVALEIDGGLFIRGRHSRGAGILKDNEKLNSAAVMGWRVIRLAPHQVRNGELTVWLKEIANDEAC